MARQNSTGATMVDEAFRDALVVAPSDTIGAAQRLRDVRGIWADVGGTVSVITDAVAARSEVFGGAPLTAASAVSFTLTAGQALKLQVAYVLATGTAATGIKALF